MLIITATAGIGRKHALLEEMMDKIENYYLPLDALQQKLIVIIFVDDDSKDYEKMMRVIITEMKDAGMHWDAVKWGFSQGCGMIAIYKKVSLLDIWGHLSSQ